MSFSPDSKTLVSGSRDGTIKLWEVETGEEIRSLNGHDGWVYSVGFSPDGKTVVSGSYDSTVKLWEVETGEQIRSLNSHDEVVSSVGFSPDGKTLVSGSGDSTIKLWDLEALSLNALVVRGCDWVRYHVAHNPVEISDDDLALCDGIGTEL